MTPSDSRSAPAVIDTLLDGVDPEPLFTPYSLGSATVANRFVMAPMTRYRSPEGVPGDEVAAYYARRASHLGLLITEATYVGHPSAGSSDRVPHFYGDDALDGWRRVAEAVHAEGGVIMPQLWHLGVIRSEGDPPYPDAPVLSPSGLVANGEQKGSAASTADIDAIIEAFATAARDAQRIGMDGVELHGAHGYLLDQFFWNATNRRSDGYGGSFAARSRIGAEVVAAIRAEVGPDFPVIVRFSQWKVGNYDARLAHTPAELEEVLAPIVQAGATAFHASTRRYWLPEFDGSERTLAGWTKEVTGLPVIAVGSIGVQTAFHGGPEATESLSLAPLLEMFERGEFDLVALGRAVLSEPEWTTKLRSGDLGGIRPYEKAHEAHLD